MRLKPENQCGTFPHGGAVTEISRGWSDRGTAGSRPPAPGALEGCEKPPLKTTVDFRHPFRMHSCSRRSPGASADLSPRVISSHLPGCSRGRKPQLVEGARFRSALLCAALALLLALPVAAQNPRPLAPSSNRFLFIFETSPGVWRQQAAIQKSVQSLLETGVSGQLRPGDTVGVWTFDRELHAGDFPLETWMPGLEAPATQRITTFLKQRKAGKGSRLDQALDGMFQVVEASESITVFLYSSGGSPVKGTPFDAEINAEFQRNVKAMGKKPMPCVTVLQARRGKLLTYTMTTLPWPVVVPALAIMPSPQEAPATPAPARVAPPKPVSVVRASEPPPAAAPVKPSQPIPTTTPEPTRPKTEPDDKGPAPQPSPPPVTVAVQPPPKPQSPVVETNIPRPEPVTTAPPPEKALVQPSPPKTEPPAVPTTPPPQPAASIRTNAAEAKNEEPLLPPLVLKIPPVSNKGAILSRTNAPPRATQTLAPSRSPAPKTNEPAIGSIAAAPLESRRSGLLFAALTLLVVAGGLILVLRQRMRAPSGPSLITQSMEHRRK